MAYLVSIIVTSLLFFGFLLLTYYESRHGVRFFAGARYKLDRKMARLGFLIEHVDWGAFTAHLTKTSLNTVAHDTAHASLMLVRAVERFLTRTVSALRRSRDATLPGTAARLESGIANLRSGLRRPRIVRDIKPREVEE